MTENITDRIPTGTECEELMARYAMLPNIIAHSRQVMRVALAVADHLKDGVSVNRDLVLAAALLHDITKTRSLKTKERHAASGGALLRELGFHGVAAIVEQHVILRNFNPEGSLEETEIVYYADKRVMHDTVVTLDERIRDLIRRYATGEEIRDQILKNGEQALIVERKIAGFMQIDIHDAFAALSK